MSDQVPCGKLWSSDTPRTDAEWAKVFAKPFAAEHMRDHARQLERDLARVTAERDEVLYELIGSKCDLRTLQDECSGWKAGAEAAEADASMSPAAADVLAERRRQIEAEGWTPEHDDEHMAGELAGAAGCYARYASVQARGGYPSTYTFPVDWPWRPSWWKPSDARRNLVKAGALILAEIERIDRAAIAAREP